MNEVFGLNTATVTGNEPTDSPTMNSVCVNPTMITAECRIMSMSECVTHFSKGLEIILVLLSVIWQHIARI